MSDSIAYECLRAAGRDPAVLRAGSVLIAGGGNVGSQTILTAAVLAITAAVVDFDTVAPKNLPHSPFLSATPLPDGSHPSKAQLLAEAHVAQSRCAGQVAYWAAQPIQAIPWGAIRRFGALIIGIDDAPSRAWAARVGALLGVPTIVAGMYPPTGNFVATSNRDADAPCFFCLRPRDSPTRTSCSLYAPESERINPALQTAAAATMNVAVEAISRFWHGDHRYDGKVFRLDLDTGEAGLSTFNRLEECPGPHERLPQSIAVQIEPTASASAILDFARRDGLKRPALELPSPFFISLPCARCGTAVPLGVPDWRVRAAPVCPGQCDGGPSSTPQVRDRVSDEDPLAGLPLCALGLGPLGLCVVECAETDEIRVYELPGSFDDVFTTVRKESR